MVIEHDKRKPVFLLLQGPSLVNIERLMLKMSGVDALWFTINSFSVLEKKLGRIFDMVWLTSFSGNVGERFSIYKYVMHGGTLITNENFKSQCPGVFDSIDDSQAHATRDQVGQVISTEIGYHPGKWVNSVTAFLWYLSKEGYENIFLFGCDGGRLEGQEIVYYGEELMDPVPPVRSKSHKKDTKRMNAAFWRGYDMYSINNRPKITNVTDNSLVTCFDTMSWDEFERSL